MRAYIATTGIVFGLLVATHIWRAFIERHLVADAFFLGATVIALAFAIWAVVLLRRS